MPALRLREIIRLVAVVRQRRRHGRPRCFEVCVRPVGVVGNEPGLGEAPGVLW